MENTFKRAVSLVMTLLMILSTIACISGVSLAADTVTENESNDGSNTATLIPTDTLCSGALNDRYDVDWFKFSSEKDYFVLNFSLDSTVNVDDVGYGWNIIIYTGDGQAMIKEYSGNKAERVTPQLPYSGDFLIKIEPADTWGTPVDCIYNIKIDTTYDNSSEDEFNDTSSTANIINTDTVYYGALNNRYDEDWYKFSSDKDYFTVDFSLPSTTNLDKVGYGWHMTIYTGDGLNVIKEYKISSKKITPELPFSGEFYIKIYPEDTWGTPVDCIYNIKINTTKDDLWESESNDTSATANSIKINTQYKGALNDRYDVDWHIFETTTGAFNVNLNVDSSVSYDKIGYGWNVSVYPYGSTSAIVTYTGVKESLKSFDIPYKGKLVVKIEPADTWGTPVDCIYNLKITEHKASELWEAEENNNANSANTIKLNKEYKGNIQTKSDDDYYTFVASINGDYELTFSRDIADSVGEGWKIKIVGTNSGEVFNESRIGKTSQNYTVKLNNVVKGEKYIVLVDVADSWYHPGKTNYSLKISTKPHSYTSKVTQAATYKSTGVKTFTCKTCGHTYSETIARKTLKAVSGLKATPSTTSVKFKWNKVSGAEKYEVYYSINGKSWKKVTSTKNSVTIKKLKSGTTYKVKVRAVVGKNKGAYSSVLTTSTKPASVTLSKLTAGPKALTATWKTVSGATGYEVQYSTSKKFSKKTTKTVTIKKAKTKKTTIKKLKKGKKYFVKVRAYKTVSGKKICGAWSSMKSINVK